jgi:hypothetical protein
MILKSGSRCLVALLLLYFSTGSFARELQGEAPRIDKAHELRVPDNLWRALVHFFPGFRLPSAADYRAQGPNSEAYYIFSFADTTLPYACWGDFNGDGWWDTATYLVPETPSAASVKLVVFHGSADGFVPIVLDSALNVHDYLLFTLSRIPPGKFLTIKGKGYKGEYPPDFPDSVVTTWDSIQFSKFGSAASMLYWKDGHYAEVPISD